MGYFQWTGAMTARAPRALAPVVLALAIGVVAVSGCAGPGYACPQSIPISPQLVYPIDGATGVPDGKFTLVVENIVGAGPNDFLSNAALLGGGANIALPLGPAPAAIPTPHLTPLPPLSDLLSAPVPTLAAHTTYAFAVTINRLGPCGGVGNAKLGSFTTQ